MIDNVYYVYFHTRLDTGQVFYVGKGHGSRSTCTSSRNKYWNNITSKCEWVSSIVQDSMSESDAFLLEMWLIAKFRHSGIKLANMTEGGDGVRMKMPFLNKVVHCSNGMRFISVNDAAEWAGIGASKISSVLNGRRKTAAGFAWWLDGDKPKEFCCPLKRTNDAAAKRRVKVLRSDGITFDSIKSAASSVSGSSSNIVKCLNGEIKKAYGFSWERMAMK